MPIPKKYLRKLSSPRAYSLYFYLNYLSNVVLLAYINKRLNVTPEGMEEIMYVRFWLSVLFQSVFALFPCAIMSLLAFGCKFKKRPLDVLLNLFLALGIWFAAYFVTQSFNSDDSALVVEAIKFNVFIAGLASLIAFPFAREKKD